MHDGDLLPTQSVLSHGAMNASLVALFFLLFYRWTLMALSLGRRSRRGAGVRDCWCRSDGAGRLRTAVGPEGLGIGVLIPLRSMGTCNLGRWMRT